MKFIFLLTTVLLSGCSSMPAHLYGTDKIDTTKLAIVVGKGNEVKILEVDDKPYTGEPSKPFYLSPGKHKFKALLSWDDMYMVSNVSFSINSSSPFVRTGCLELEPGKSYLIAASDSSKNWRLMYFKTFIEKVELSECD